MPHEWDCLVYFPVHVIVHSQKKFWLLQDIKNHWLLKLRLMVKLSTLYILPIIKQSKEQQNNENNTRTPWLHHSITFSITPCQAFLYTTNWSPLATTWFSASIVESLTFICLLFCNLNPSDLLVVSKTWRVCGLLTWSLSLESFDASSLPRRSTLSLWF